MSDLLLPPGATPASKIYQKVPCPVRSTPVLSPQGIVIVDAPCQSSCPWWLGEESPGAPLCAVRALGLALVQAQRASPPKPD